MRGYKRPPVEDVVGSALHRFEAAKRAGLEETEAMTVALTYYGLRVSGRKLPTPAAPLARGVARGLSAYKQTGNPWLALEASLAFMTSVFPAKATRDDANRPVPPNDAVPEK